MPDDLRDRYVSECFPEGLSPRAAAAMSLLRLLLPWSSSRQRGERMTLFPYRVVFVLRVFKLSSDGTVAADLV